MTLAPFSANAFAIALPIPPLPPVTTAFLLTKLYGKVVSKVLNRSKIDNKMNGILLFFLLTRKNM